MNETVEKLKRRQLLSWRRHPHREATEQVNALIEVAWSLHRTDTSFAMQLSEEALRLATRNDYGRERALALFNLGWCQHLVSNYKRAADALEESRDILNKLTLQDDAALTATLNGLDATQNSLGRYENALQNYYAALHLYKKVGDKPRAALINLNLGITYRRTNDYSTALNYCYQALCDLIEVDAPLYQVSACINVGDVLWRVGEAEQAIECLQQAISVFRKLNIRRYEGVAILSLGAARQSRGEFEQAAENYRYGLTVAQAVDDLEIQAVAQLRLGSLAIEQDEAERALAFLSDALPSTQKIGSCFYESETLLQLGVAYAKFGDHKQSVQLLERALEISQQIDSKEVEYKAHLALSQAFEHSKIICRRHCFTIKHFTKNGKRCTARLLRNESGNCCPRCLSSAAVSLVERCALITPIIWREPSAEMRQQSNRLLLCRADAAQTTTSG